MIKRENGQVSRRRNTVVQGSYGMLREGTGVFSLMQLRSAARDAHQLYDGLVSGLDLIAGLQFDVQEARRRMLYALTTTDPNLQVEYADESRAADERVKQRIAEHKAHLAHPSDVAAALLFERDWAAYLRVRDEVIASILEGQTADAIANDLRLGAVTFDRARADLLAMQERYKADAELRRQDVEEASLQSFELVIVVLLLTQLLVFFGLRQIQAGELLERERCSRATVGCCSGTRRPNACPGGHATPCSASDSPRPGLSSPAPPWEPPWPAPSPIAACAQRDCPCTSPTWSASECSTSAPSRSRTASRCSSRTSPT